MFQYFHNEQWHVLTSYCDVLKDIHGSSIYDSLWEVSVPSDKCYDVYIIADNYFRSAVST